MLVVLVARGASWTGAEGRAVASPGPTAHAVAIDVRPRSSASAAGARRERIAPHRRIQDRPEDGGEPEAPAGRPTLGGMAKKGARRTGRGRGGAAGDATWVPIGSGDGGIRHLMEELHGRYPWLEGVDDRAVRIELVGGPDAVQVSVRSDQVPSDWAPPRTGHALD